MKEKMIGMVWKSRCGSVHGNEQMRRVSQRCLDSGGRYWSLTKHWSPGGLDVKVMTNAHAQISFRDVRTLIHT